MSKVSAKSGAPPGTLMHIGDQPDSEVRIRVFEFGQNQFAEHDMELTDLSELEKLRESGQQVWVNVDGVHHTETVERIGRIFGIHALVLEDIVNTDQRPKMEDYQDYLYFVLRMADMDPQHELEVEQVSIVLGDNYILSFQEEPGDVWDPIRERLRQPANKIRRMGPDYLGYSLMDAVVDRYFLILERMGEQIDDLEERLIADADKRTLSEIHDIKREVIHLRKAAWPMRELVSNLQRIDSSLIKPELNIFFRDLYDHTMRVIDTIESFRDSLSSMVDLYLSSASIKMNEIMKVLTVISTIFIPLTFVTGYYGMNIDMWETHKAWSYPMVVVIMLLMVGGQLYYFRRKKWL